MEQLEEIAGQPRMAGQRVGQVAQPERRAELAQVGRIGPERRRLAPVGAGRDDEAVVPVVVGLAAEHRQEAALEPLVVPLQLDARAIAQLQHHVVQRHVALAVGKPRPDVIGALVDGRETHVLQNRHALGERDRRAQRIDDRMDAGARLAGLAMEIDHHGLLGSEPLDALDILQRPLRREGLGIPRREGACVLGKQHPRVTALAGDGVGQAVLPGAHDLGDLALEDGRVGLRRLPAIAADDELHAHQRAFGKVGIEGGDAPLVGVRQ